MLAYLLRFGASALGKIFTWLRESDRSSGICFLSVKSVHGATLLEAPETLNFLTCSVVPREPGGGDTAAVWMHDKVGRGHHLSLIIRLSSRRRAIVTPSRENRQLPTATSRHARHEVRPKGSGKKEPHGNVAEEPSIASAVHATVTSNWTHFESNWILF